jgi:hypothetical protein
MEQVLRNMALIMLTRFCKDHSIDCSGTYCTKDGRGFSYKLVDQETGQRTIARITFKKDAVPVFGF